MKSNNATTALGFYSPDGSFQPIHVLNTVSLEFASKSTYELEIMLDEHVQLERYEKCAQIRDEIIRRALMKQNN
jgi:hypothetical protein